jgi:hypothetical protein
MRTVHPAIHEVALGAGLPAAPTELCATMAASDRAAGGADTVLPPCGNGPGGGFLPHADILPLTHSPTRSAARQAKTIPDSGPHTHQIAQSACSVSCLPLAHQSVLFGPSCDTVLHVVTEKSGHSHESARTLRSRLKGSRSGEVSRRLSNLAHSLACACKKLQYRVAALGCVFVGSPIANETTQDKDSRAETNVIISPLTASSRCPFKP